MKTILQFSFILLIMFLLNGCSISQLTVKAAMPLIDGGVAAINQESDLQLAKSAIPGNISLIEGMLINDPDNESLRLYAAEAYYGYAFGFVEDSDPQRATELYLRGYRHALHALLNRGLSKQALNGELESLQEDINKLGKSSVPALFWTASCRAKAIDLNRDSAKSLAQLPKAVMMMQRVLDLDENFYLSGAHIFFGVYYGSKSPMLGGNYTLAEQHFNKANAANDNKLLVVDLLQAKYLERQRFNRADFHKLLTHIINAPDDLYPQQALINAISKQKASLYLEKEDLWF